MLFQMDLELPRQGDLSSAFGGYGFSPISLCRTSAMPDR